MSKPEQCPTADATGRGAGREPPLLEVEDLRVEFPTEGGVVHAVNGVSFAIERGRTLGIVGESGSGKSVCALSAMGLTRAQGARISGRILFEGVDLLALPERGMRGLRGNELAMIFQDPLSSLHPLYRVGAQIVEGIRAHREVSRRAAREQAIALLDLVGIPGAGGGPIPVDAYPHELSGGMRQRVMIAMALANEPKLLIADEPTTALDVTVQAQILALLRRLREELGMALVLVTHDLGVVAEMADEIAVMQAGLIVERGSAERVLAAPQHPYTQGLLRSAPTLERPREAEGAREGEGNRGREEEEREGEGNRGREEEEREGEGNRGREEEEREGGGVSRMESGTGSARPSRCWRYATWSSAFRSHAALCFNARSMPSRPSPGSASSCDAARRSDWWGRVAAARAPPRA